MKFDDAAAYQNSHNIQLQSGKHPEAKRSERTSLLREQGVAGLNPVIPSTIYPFTLFWTTSIGIQAKFLLTLHSSNLPPAFNPSYQW